MHHDTVITRATGLEGVDAAQRERLTPCILQHCWPGRTAGGRRTRTHDGTGLGSRGPRTAAGPRLKPASAPETRLRGDAAVPACCASGPWCNEASASGDLGNQVGQLPGDGPSEEGRGDGGEGGQRCLAAVYGRAALPRMPSQRARAREGGGFCLCLRLV